VNKSFLKKNNNKLYEKLMQEIAIMKKLDHPNIIKLLDVIDTAGYICIILEYASEGDLFEYILKDDKLDEN